MKNTERRKDMNYIEDRKCNKGSCEENATALIKQRYLCGKHEEEVKNKRKSISQLNYWANFFKKSKGGWK